MKLARIGRLAPVAIAGTLLLTSCAANEIGLDAASGSLAGELNGSGASSQGAASDAWIAGFQTENPGVTINYSPDGSGAGRKAFISGGVAYAGSDSALSDHELTGTFAACAAGTTGIDLPVYISPIVLIVNVHGVDTLNLDAPTIAKIFKGDITQWDDPAISKLNPGAKLPPAPISAVHRSDDSGTTKNFTDYLHTVAPAVWDAAPNDTFPYVGGEAAQGTSGVVDAVTNGTNTIGYADASRAGNLSVVALKVGDTFVNYSATAAAKVVADSPLVAGRSANDIAINLNRATTDPSHYPLVLVSYIIVCQEYQHATAANLVKAYLGYVASTVGQQTSADLAGAAPLTSALSKKVAAAIDSITSTTPK